MLKPPFLATGRTTLTIVRPTAGTYDDNGRYIEGSTSTFNIVANVQPGLKFNDTQFLPEGERGRLAVRVYTDTEIRARKEGEQNSGTLIDSYSLNDDGSSALDLAFAFAGPAVGYNLDQLSYTTQGLNQEAILTVIDWADSDIELPLYNATVTVSVSETNGVSCGLGILFYKDGVVTNRVRVEATGDDQELKMVVSPEGFIKAFVDDADAPLLFDNTDYVTIPSDNKWIVFLWVDDNSVGDLVSMSLSVNIPQALPSQPGHDADRFWWDGNTYVVRWCHNYAMGILNHWKAIAVAEETT